MTRLERLLVRPEESSIADRIAVLLNQLPGRLSGIKFIENSSRGLDLTSLEEPLLEDDTNGLEGEIAVKNAMRRYRQFLTLPILKYRFLGPLADKIEVTPTVAIDMVWHEHIRQLKKYRADCRQAFGRVLPHIPDDEAEKILRPDVKPLKDRLFGLDTKMSDRQFNFIMTAEIYHRYFNELYFEGHEPLGSRLSLKNDRDKPQRRDLEDVVEDLVEVVETSSGNSGADSAGGADAGCGGGGCGGCGG